MNSPYYTPQTQINNKNFSGSVNEAPYNANQQSDSKNTNNQYLLLSQEQKNQLDLSHKEQIQNIRKNKSKNQRELHEKMINSQRLKSKQEIVQKNSLITFNEEIQNLYLELKNKCLNWNNEVIDQENLELLKEYDGYFKQVQNKEEFQTKYVKLASTKDNVKYLNCQCCRNSNQQLCDCTICNQSSQSNVQRCMKYCFCCGFSFSMQVLGWLTLGIIIVPFCIISKSFEPCQDTIKCKLIENGRKNFENCCKQLSCLCPYCSCCWINIGCCPIAAIKNTSQCAKTCCGDYVDCCQLICCSKKQVIKKLKGIYEKYEKPILQGEQN